MALVDIYGNVRNLRVGDKVTVRRYGQDSYNGIAVEFATDETAGMRLVTNGDVRDNKIVFPEIEYSLAIASQILLLIEVTSNLRGKVIGKTDKCVMFQLE